MNETIEKNKTKNSSERVFFKKPDLSEECSQTTRLASPEHNERMLSVYPTSKGFGYLILENTENIIH